MASGTGARGGRWHGSSYRKSEYKNIAKVIITVGLYLSWVYKM
jgi:hypothetical protein